MTTATDQDLRAIVYLARRVRKGIGARQWTEDELMAELACYIGHDLGTVVDFVNRGARDKGLQRAAGLHKGSHRTEPPAGAPFVPEVLDPTQRCSICSKSEPACRILSRVSDHEFLSEVEAAKLAAGTPEALHGVIVALKEGITATPPPPTTEGLDAYAAEKPELRVRLDALLAANSGLSLPAQSLPEPAPSEGEPMRVEAAEAVASEEMADG